jgi:hypothetical protein
MAGKETARTPTGAEVRTVIQHMTKRMRWPNTGMAWPQSLRSRQAMEWAEDNGADYFLAGRQRNA